MFALIVSLQECKNDSMKTDCDGHGECQTLENNATICECEPGFAGEFCTECADGFMRSTDGFRCVNISACMVNVTVGDGVELKECYDHGFCTVDENEKQGTVSWFCKCKNHFVNETGRGNNTYPTYCSECMNRYSLTEEVNNSDAKCIPKECKSGDGEIKNTVIECNNYGMCLDLSTGNKKIDLVIDVVVSLIESVLGIDIPNPGCLCRTPHMDEKCQGCAATYRMLEEEEEHGLSGSKQCVKDNCYQYDEDGKPTIAECNSPSQGQCVLDSFTKEMKCECRGNYNSSTQCTSCIYHFSIDSDCTQCEAGYDVSTYCFQCSFGRNETENCTKCLAGYDPNDDCRTCLHGKDPLTRCTECPTGLVEGADGECVKANSSGNTTVVVVVSVIAGVVAVVAIVWVTLYCIRKRHAAQYAAMPTLDEVEPIAQDGESGDEQQGGAVV